MGGPEKKKLLRRLLQNCPSSTGEVESRGCKGRVKLYLCSGRNFNWGANKRDRIKGTALNGERGILSKKKGLSHSGLWRRSGVGPHGKAPSSTAERRNFASRGGEIQK